MALRFCDSFDHYATAQLALKYTNISAPTGTVVSIVGTGRTANGMFFSPQLGASTYAQRTLDAQPTWIVGFALTLSALPAAQVGIAALFDGASRQVDLSIDTAGHLVIARNGTTLGTSTNVLATVGYNYIEWKMTIASSIAAHSCVARVNGNVWVDLAAAANTKATANATADSVLIGDTYGARSTINYTVDDLYVLDGTGSVNVDFLGDVTVEALLPNADGAHADFAVTGSASAHLATSEVPPDGDTSYVAANSVGARESLLLPNPAGTVLTAFGLQTVLDLRKQGSGTRTAAASLRLGGADYDGTAVALGTSYLFAVEARDVNPATGAAWTPTGFNSLEVGIKVVT